MNKSLREQDYLSHIEEAICRIQRYLARNRPIEIGSNIAKRRSPYRYPSFLAKSSAFKCV